MRCQITKPCLLRAAASVIGEPVAFAQCRGGTGHRADIWGASGRFYQLKWTRRCREIVGQWVSRRAYLDHFRENY
jgi:hypothetical protein